MKNLVFKKSFILLTTMLLLVGGFLVSAPLVHAETSVANEAQLLAAVADVNETVITLSADITLTSYLNVGRTVTINGAGFTLTRIVNNTATDESYAIMVSAGTLTASNLKIVSTITGTSFSGGSSAVGITVQTGASLNLSGSTITAQAVYGLVYGVFAQGANTITLSGNTFVFSGLDATAGAHRIMLGVEGVASTLSLTNNTINSTFGDSGTQQEIKLVVNAPGSTLAAIKTYAETGDKVAVGEKLRVTDAIDVSVKTIYKRTSTGWTTPVTDETELLAALAGSSDIVLKNSFAIASHVIVGRTVTIDGAGFTLTRTTAPSDSFESYAIMVSSGTLTASNLKIVSNNTGTGNAVGITVQTGAALNLSGSTITAEANYGLVYGVYAQPGVTAVTLSTNSFIFSGSDATAGAHRIMLGMETIDTTSVSLTSNTITSTLHTAQEEIRLMVCADGVDCAVGASKTIAQIKGYAAMGDKVAIGEKLRATASDAARAIYTRPSTGWDTPIEATAIAGVTPPVTGATPVTTVTAGTGYTGTVTWSPTVASTFAGGTVYTATITLTAATGYTLTGVTTDQFTIAGSTSDTNSANAGVITAVFPATASASHGGGGGSTTPPVVTPVTCTLPQVRNATTNTCVTPTVTCTLPLVLNASANACVTPTTPDQGCSGGNLFNTSTGAACINNAAPQGCSGGNAFNTSTGAVCTNNAEIPGCGNKTTGFSTASGLSCVNNRVTSATSTYNFGLGTLKNGSKGEGVKELQRFLNAKLSLGLVVDGKLGPKTIAVIKKWQKAHALVVDGLVGPKTKAKMNAEE